MNSTSLEFIRQALNDYAATLAPSARTAFSIVANQHFEVVARSVQEAAAAKAAAPPPDPEA